MNNMNSETANHTRHRAFSLYRETPMEYAGFKAVLRQPHRAMKIASCFLLLALAPASRAADAQSPRTSLRQPPSRISTTPSVTTLPSYGRQPTGRPMVGRIQNGYPPQRIARLNMRGSSGRDQQSLEAIEKGLDWLTENQKEDGHWELGGTKRSDIAATSAAIMCYLGWGVNHKRPATDNDPSHVNALRKGLDWLADKVGDDGKAADGGNMYAHSLCVKALAEAYKSTEDAALQGPLTRATAYLMRSQNPQTGGWRYQSYTVRRDPGDMSVSGYTVMAMVLAKNAGMAVDDDRVDLSKKFLDSVSSGEHKGLYSYKTAPTATTQPANANNRTRRPAPRVPLTAQGMLCQQLYGMGSNNNRIVESAQYLFRNQPESDDPNYYYWFFGTLAMDRFMPSDRDLRGSRDRWLATMMTLFRGRQESDGHWDPEGFKSRSFGPTLTTCYALLSLQVAWDRLMQFN